MLRRSFAVFTIAFVAFAVSATPAYSAGLSGTATCDTPASFGLATISPPLPAQTPSVKRSKVLLTSDLGSCVADNPAVAIARISVKGTLPKGSSCSSEFVEGVEAPLHLTGTVKVTWIGRNGERYTASKARIASVTIEETPAYVLTIVTVPISGGSFRGKVITVDATIRNLLELETQCLNPSGAVSQIEFSPVELHVA